MDESQCYFQLLPNEILLKILQQLSTCDVINFCEIYPEYEYFFEERRVVNVVNLSKKSGFKRIHSFSNIIKKLRSECITVFNITYVYWVTAADIRKCLKKLKNLEELHILGTKVGLAAADCDSYKSSKLHKLALSIEDKQLQQSKAQYFPNIRSLCVQIVSKNDHTFQYRLQCIIKDLKKLEELWVQDITGSYPLDYDHLAYTGTNLKIFAFKALCSMFSDLRFRGLNKVFFNERTGRQAYYEKIDSGVNDPRSLAENPAWKILNELHAETPYGLRDAKKLAYQDTNINDILFEELNFMHSTNRCCPRYVNAIKDIISSKNGRKLKKLTLTNCLFIDQPLEVCPDNPKRRKKYNHHEPPSEEQKVLINNLQFLNELEIYVCSRYQGFRIYYFIQYMKNLTQLSLEIPGPLNGEFLKHVFENCESLESLKLNLVMSNESFNHDFCRYISLAKNLKNLRFQHYRVALENLFSGLSAIKTPKMEKLFLKCKSVDNFGMKYLNEFLLKNPSLDFFIIIINSATDSMLKLIVDEMAKFKDTGKVFMAKKNEKVFTGSFPIPDIYKFELMSPHSSVANLNIFEEFYKPYISNSIKKRLVALGNCRGKAIA